MSKALNITVTLLVYINVIAQNSQPRELRFNNLLVKDGMPAAETSDILQDQEGYIWLGTANGLVRYDSYTPKVYNFGIDDPNLLPISNLYQDRKGQLWVGTLYRGLYR